MQRIFQFEMKITINIPDDLIKQAIKISDTEIKTELIMKALQQMVGLYKRKK